MRFMTGKDMELTPHLVTSFGGGMGGYSYHYRHIEVLSIEGSTIKATGYSVPPAWLKPVNLFCVFGEFLYVFRMENVGRPTRDEVRSLLCADAIEKARSCLKDACKGYKEPDLAIPVITRQQIVACGHWQYVGPAPEVEEYYKVCYEKKDGIHIPVCDRDGYSDHAIHNDLEEAREHAKREDGVCYVVKTTEQVV